MIRFIFWPTLYIYFQFSLHNRGDTRSRNLYEKLAPNRTQLHSRKVSDTSFLSVCHPYYTWQSKFLCSVCCGTQKEEIKPRIARQRPGIPAGATTWSLRIWWVVFLWCRVEILPKGVLLFKSVQVSDSGVYTCRAVNAFGTTSRNITLTVRGESVQSQTYILVWLCKIIWNPVWSLASFTHGVKCQVSSSDLNSKTEQDRDRKLTNGK